MGSFTWFLMREINQKDLENVPSGALELYLLTPGYTHRDTGCQSDNSELHLSYSSKKNHQREKTVKIP